MYRFYFVTKCSSESHQWRFVTRHLEKRKSVHIFETPTLLAIEVQCPPVDLALDKIIRFELSFDDRLQRRRKCHHKVIEQFKFYFS